MGLFESIRKKEKMEESVRSYFKLMNGYIPTFTTFEGSIYEMELTRAAIHCFATHASKLKPEIKGANNKNLERKLQYRPNRNMDTKKYLYRLATVYSVDNTAFIAPLYDNTFNLTGFYPLATRKCRIVEYDGQKYVRYQLSQGNYAACELERMGIMTQFQYEDELFGSSNSCLKPTMELINTQNQGIIQGVKNSASIRFIAKLAQSLKRKAIDEERQRFTEDNLSVDNNGGVMMFDAKYEDVKQIDSKPFVVNPAQMTQIKDNVFNYFGCNEQILQNKANSEEWAAYYEGKIEPFALEASLVHTNMAFTEREITYENQIMFTSNRMQYWSPEEKKSIVVDLFDRGFITHNQGLEIFNMPPVEGGDKRYIRKEYALTSNFDDLKTKEGVIDDADKQRETIPNVEPVGDKD